MTRKGRIWALLAFLVLGCGGGKNPPQVSKAKPEHTTVDTLPQDTTLPPRYESIHKLQYQEHEEE